MKRVLLISGDLIREGEQPMSYASACLLARLRSDPNYGLSFTVEHRSVNLLIEKPAGNPSSYLEATQDIDYRDIDLLALSVFVWSEPLINPFLDEIRRRGFRGKVVLGGAQISYASNGDHDETLRYLRRAYPNADAFVLGNGEEALLSICKEGLPEPLLKQSTAFDSLPSPYLMEVLKPSRMLRMETQRGCMFSCSFCAHRDVISGKVARTDMKRVFEELEHFKSAGVQRINVLDPVFNSGPRSIQILDIVRELGLSAQFTFQTRFETMKGEFLDAVDGMDVVLEFGLQTMNRDEGHAVNRANDIAKVESWINELNRREIQYEVSMIYGLPMQTLESFRNGIDRLTDLGVKTIRAWPLKLLRGTPLAAERERYGFQETKLGDYLIPYVTSSHSFTRDDWEKMHEIASGLPDHDRI